MKIIAKDEIMKIIAKDERMKIIAKNEFKYNYNTMTDPKTNKTIQVKNSPSQYLKIAESPGGLSMANVLVNMTSDLGNEDVVKSNVLSVGRDASITYIYLDSYNKLHSFDYSLFTSNNAKPMALQRLERAGPSKRIATIACDGKDFCVVSWLPVFTELDKDPNYKPVNEIDLDTIKREMPTMKDMCEAYIAKMAMLEDPAASPLRVLSYLEYQVDILTRLLSIMIGFMPDQQIQELQDKMGIDKETFEVILSKINESSVLDLKKDSMLALDRMAQKKAQFREIQTEYLIAKYPLKETNS